MFTKLNLSKPMRTYRGYAIKIVPTLATGMGDPNLVTVINPIIGIPYTINKTTGKTFTIGGEADLPPSQVLETYYDVMMNDHDNIEPPYDAFDIDKTIYTKSGIPVVFSPFTDNSGLPCFDVYNRKMGGSYTVKQSNGEVARAGNFKGMTEEELLDYDLAFNSYKKEESPMVTPTVPMALEIPTLAGGKDILSSIEKHKEAIAAHRDALREILDDIEAVVDSCDEAIESLDSAVSYLSQYV